MTSGDAIQALFNQKRYDQGIRVGEKELKTLAESGQSDAYVILPLARCYAEKAYKSPHQTTKQKCYERALELLDNALAEMPENVSYLQLQAEIFYKQREYTRAEEKFHQMKELDPEEQTFWVLPWIARIQLETERFTEAEATGEENLRLLDANPGSPHDKRSRASILMTLIKSKMAQDLPEKYSQAEALAKQLFSIGIANDDGYLTAMGLSYQGKTQLAQGKWQEAQATGQELLEFGKWEKSSRDISTAQFLIRNAEQCRLFHFSYCPPHLRGKRPPPTTGFVR